MGSDISKALGEDIVKGDVFDIFGMGKAMDIEEEAEMTRKNIERMRRSAESMRLETIRRIQERNLVASRGAAFARREAARSTGRETTIF